MLNKKINVASLRAMRKASYLAGKSAHKAGSIFNRVESKTTQLIHRNGGGKEGAGEHIDGFFHKNFPYMLPIHPALPRLDQKPSVTVFVPSLTPRGFYGGIATLLIVSAKLAQTLGYNYRIVQTSGFEKNSKVLEFLADNDIIIPTDRYDTIDVSKRSPENFAYLPLHQDDVVVVSAWWDALAASKLPLKKKFIYMIQDYEPIFYNNSDEQVFAEQTYHTNNFIPLCNTELLYRFFKEKSYKYIANNAIWFEPAVGKSPVKHRASQSKKIFLYGRPAVHRNLFFNALKAIDEALQSEEMRQYNWEVYSAGQSDISNILLKSGHTVTNLGKMDLKEYYKFASAIDVAVSPMLAPHPNYPTLELASLGAAVVSTKYETKSDLSFYSKNIFMSDPDSHSMSEAIIKAGTISSNVLNDNLKTNNISNDWSANLEQPLRKVIDAISIK